MNETSEEKNSVFFFLSFVDSKNQHTNIVNYNSCLVKSDAKKRVYI